MDRVPASDKSRDAGRAAMPCFPLRTFLTHETEPAPYPRLFCRIRLAVPWSLCLGEPSRR
jgi:hypothetical protein